MLTWIAFIASIAACFIARPHAVALGRRASRKKALIHFGKQIEMGPTEEVFTHPRNSRTQDYITGRIG